MIDVDAINAAVGSPFVAAQLLGLEIARGSRDHRVTVFCPWHTEKRASCVLVEKDGKVVAHCKSCNAGGDFLALVAAVNGLDHRHDFRRVGELAADLVGITLDETCSQQHHKGHPARQRDPIAELAARIDAAGRDWLRGRDCRPDPVIDGASKADVDEALGLLASLVDQRVSRYLELERLADDYEDSPRNLWLHQPEARTEAA